LPCAGSSKSVLVEGFTGELGQPLQSAPPQWSGLRARVSVGAASNASRLTGLRLTLRNVSSLPIVLAPCPAYSTSIVARSHRGLFLVGSGSRTLECARTPVTIAPRHTVRFALHRRSYVGGHPAFRTGHVTLHVGIGGILIITKAGL
jgi:hypothetical protein